MMETAAGDLGWCEVCEEQPATQRAKRHWDARICAECAEGEPDYEEAAQ